MMESMMQNMQNGMIGGHHWSEFAEFGTAGDLNKIAGVAVKHMSAQDGMTKRILKSNNCLIKQGRH